MKPSATKNLTSNTGKPYCLVELGDFLFFGGDVQKMFEVTGFDERSRPLSGETDLFQLQKDTEILPINFEK